MAQKHYVPMTFASWFVDVNSVSSGENLTYNNFGDNTGWVTKRFSEYYPTTVSKELDQFMEKFWNEKDAPVVVDGSTLPKANISEDDSGLTMEFSIPFANKEDIHVTLDPVVNSIKLEVESHQGEGDGREYHLKEISRTSFKRTFILDRRFEISEATAEFEGAILTVVVPYREDSAKKQLTIK